MIIQVHWIKIQSISPRCCAKTNKQTNKKRNDPIYPGGIICSVLCKCIETNFSSLEAPAIVHFGIILSHLAIHHLKSPIYFIWICLWRHPSQNCDIYFGSMAPYVSVGVFIWEWGWEAKTLLKDMYRINHVSVQTGLNWVEGSQENTFLIQLIQLQLSRCVALLINSLQGLQSISYKMQKKLSLKGTLESFSNESARQCSKQITADL